MTREELIDHLREMDVEYMIKTENTYSDEYRGNNLVTVRFWVEENSDATR